MTLLLRWLTQSQFAGYFAAREMGFFAEQCLDVTILDGGGIFGGINITAASADFGIPWFLQFLELIDGGSDYIHVAQIFQRPAWRYFGMPVPGTMDPNAVTKNTVKNFGDMKNGVRFGIPRPYIETPLKSLLLKYGKTFCGATDWRTDSFTNCTGDEDIEFVVYGYNVTNIGTMEIPFFQGMMYNELGRLLLTTDDRGNFKYTINTPGAPENVAVYSAYEIDDLLLPEDGLMIHHELTRDAESRNLIVRFLTAAYKGWIHCRDNEHACVSIIAPNFGNTKQQIEHTLQTWQMREVNRAMWPARVGVGIHNLTESLKAAEIGREIGSLVNFDGNITSDRMSSIITEAFTLEAHYGLVAQGLDIHGAEWINKTGIRFCLSAEGVPTECASAAEQSSTRLALMIGIPVSVVSALLLALAWHTYRLRRKLRELQEDPTVTSLDLEAPITKVRNVLKKVISIEGDRVTPELTQELRDLMAALQKSHDMNMPDLQRQLLKIDTNVYSSDLALFLVETTMQGDVSTHGGALRHASNNALGRSPSNSFTSASRMLLCMHSEADEHKPNAPAPKREMQDMYNFILSVHPEADDMLHEIGISPSMDMLTFSSLGNSQLLITVTFHIFRTVHDLVLPLRLDDYKLMNFLKALEAGMHGPKLHNMRHAADTMSRVSAMLKMGGLYQQATQSMKRQLAAALIASIVPDYKHPGRTNVFHVKRASAAALSFNEQHVNENNSLYACLNVLRDPKCNFIEAWSEEEQREFKSTLIELVLGSDTDSHFELLTRFQMRVNTETEGYGGILASRFFGSCDRRTRLLVLQLAIVCGLHGDAVLPFEVHKKWVQLKQDEYFEQGDEEHALGLPISGLMDRSRPGVADPKTQVGWLDIIVIPIFQQFCNVFIDCHDLLQQCQENRALWEQEQANGFVGKAQFSPGLFMGLEGILRSDESRSQTPSVLSGSASDHVQSRQNSCSMHHPTRFPGTV